jgi:FMN reductase
MNLPMYEPGRSLDDYGPEVERLIEALREADALILGAAAYHGTLAGVTENALVFAQVLARDERPYLEDRVVGLTSTAGGEQAAAHTTDAMVHIVHALRGVVAPLMVTIPRAWQRSDDEGNITDERYGGRLDRLGRLVVELAGRMNLESGRAEAVGVAV